MAAQVPQSFRQRPHPSNKPLHLYQIRIIRRVVLRKWVWWRWVLSWGTDYSTKGSRRDEYQQHHISRFSRMHATHV